MFCNRFFFIAALTFATLHLSAAQLSDPVSYEATTYLLPDRTEGTVKNRVSLDGEWEVRLSPKSRWHKVAVPGELAMQGLAVRHDAPVTYRRKFNVPADFAGKKIILRFNGAYSYATLSINGKEVRKHRGGFTRWDTDVTRYVRPGKTNELQLTLIDPVEEISYASGYAHHPVCGILRSVVLFAQPETFFTDLKMDAEVDTAYTDGELHLSMIWDTPVAGNEEIFVELTDPAGKIAAEDRFTVHEGKNSFTLPVKKPVKWDAEHPRLYTVRINVSHEGKECASITRKVGFRRIEIKGNRMLVNGSPVKLRGACRHDIHPRLGRSTDRATDSIDALLFKEANMNFVRTSHYPPTEDFLEFCDRYGIYVESETAVCFVDTHRQKNYAPGASQSDPVHTAQYLGQLSEMAKNFQSHPSILFWSIGNESKYGDNFQKSYDWIKAYDKTRPVIFSYPGSIPADKNPIYDLASMHYQDVNGNLWQWGVESRGFEVKGYPTIFDEWAHPACYTYATLQHDPGIREFWGKSLDMMWDGVYRTPGALGGAIWGYIDEVFFLPKPKEGTSYWKDFAHTAKPEGFRGDCVGYGEWGIVDVFRRKKPEFWATKKAYSPVRIETPRRIDPMPNTDVILDLYNRFDHTDLSENKAVVSYRGDKTVIAMPRTAPHQKSVLRIPARDWQHGDSLMVEIEDAAGAMIDRYIFTIGSPVSDTDNKKQTASPLQIDENADYIVVKNATLEVPFSKSTGLITGATLDGDTIIEKGPFFNAYVNYNHLTGAEIRKISDHLTTSPADWRKQSFDIRKSASGDVIASVSGTFGSVKVNYQIVITPSGEITTAYIADGLPEGYVRETGLSFSLPDNYSRLKWIREGYWDNYPADAMSGNRGDAPLYNDKVHTYGTRPSQEDWASDTKNFYYWADKGADFDRSLTVRAKAMKENISQYSLVMPSGLSLSVVSPTSDVACRLEKISDKRLMLFADNKWDYPEIAWGNYCKVISPNPCHGQITLILRQ